MAGGYFSKNVKKLFAQEINKSENFFCELKLGIGGCGVLELPDVIDYLFTTMEVVHKQRARFIRKNKGFIKRFFITYDSSTDMYEPYFKFLLLSNKSKQDTELLKLHLQTYHQWHNVWCLVNKNFDDIVVKLEPLENEKAQEIVSEFFKQPTIEETFMLGEAEKKEILKTHRTVSVGGIFKDIKQKYLLSVER